MRTVKYTNRFKRDQRREQRRPGGIWSAMRMPVVQLIPSFWLFTITVVTLECIGMVLTYLEQGYFQNKWWSLGYVESLSIPLTLIPIFLWFAFVPRLLRFDDRELEIKFLF